MQFITFLRARPERDPQVFKDWYLGDYARRLQVGCPDIRRHIINLTEPGPQELRLAHDSDDPQARYDVVAQMWFEEAIPAQQILSIVDGDELAGWADVRHSYRVSDTVILDKLAAEPPPANGFKLLRELLFYDDMSDATARRCWAHHAKLAVKVHVGMTRYVQHWIEERLTPQTPGARGISELFFSTREDLVQRYYESPRGREEILHDTAHFIQARLPRVYSREFVLKL
jgi:hypothetical protein